MKVYAATNTGLQLSEIGAYARRVETIGFDALKVPETVHDSLMMSALALEHTTRLEVLSAVTLAFPRSPMVTAYAAWDLHRFSGGRFSLGLGTQVKGNIERRYSVAWSQPVERLREYVVSLQAIFEAFEQGGPLRFEGDHYQFTRLQPYFNPGPGPSPEKRLKMYLGGINRGICRAAGALTDGLITHPTNSNRQFLASVALPALREGAAERDDGLGTELIVGSALATGRTAEAVQRRREEHRGSLAFLYSTPAYWPTLELHGWGDLGHRLHDLSRAGKWGDMEAAISDEMLETLVPTGTYDVIADVLLEWFGDLATGISLPLPNDPDDDRALAKVVARLQESGAETT